MAGDDRDDLNENENENVTSGQALDDLTVLSDVGTSDMGPTRLNVARAVDVDDAKLGSLATVHQGSESAPDVQDGAIFTTGEIGIDDVSIDGVETISQVAAIDSLETETAAPAAIAETAPIEGSDNSQADLSTDNFVFGDPMPTTVDDIQGEAFVDVEAEPVVEVAEAVVQTAAAESELPPAPIIGGISIDDPATPEFDLSPAPTSLNLIEDQADIRFGVDVSGSDGNALTYEFSDPAGGEIIPDPDFPGYYLLKLDQDWHGTDRFVVTVRDSFGRSAQQVIDLNIAAVADAPDAQGVEFVTGAEDTAIALDLKYDLAQFESLDSISISDFPPGSMLVVGDDIITADEDGNLVLSGEQLAAVAHVGEGNVVTLDGVSILPPKDFDGTFNIEVKATSVDVSADGTESFASSTHTLQVDVTESEITFVTDGGPLAVEVSQDGTGQGTVSAVSADGDPLTYALVDADGNQVTELTTEHGTVTIDAATGEYTFTPNDGTKALDDGETASDQFSVVAIQGDTVSQPQTVDVTITGTNDEPVIKTTKAIDAGQEGSASGTVAGSDIDTNDTVSYYLLDENGERVTELTTENGSVTIDTATGEYTFTPNADSKELGEGETATDGFQVVAFDGTAESAPQDVGVTITGSNDGPVVDTTSAIDVGQEGSATGTVAGSDIDTNDTVSYYLLDDNGERVTELTTENGSVAIDTATGEYTFTPNEAMQELGEGASAADGFQVVAFDGTAESAPQDVGVTITGSNDGPVVDTTEDLSVSEDGTATGSVAGSDVDAGDTVSYYLLDENGERVTELTTENGSVAIDTATGEYTFTPNEAMQELGEGASAADSFQVVAFDGTAESAPQDVGVTITGTNDEPVIDVTQAPVIAGVEDQAIIVRPEDLLANASDVDSNDTLSIANLRVEGASIPVTLKISGDHYDPNNVQDVGAGSPKFQIMVNGKTISVDGQSTFQVDAVRGTLEHFSFNVPADTTIQSIGIKYVNDSWDGPDDRDGDGILGEDRNLIVDKINIGGVVEADGSFSGGVMLEAEDASYARSSGDVIPGRETMAWSGTLNFDVSKVAPDAYAPVVANPDGTWTIRAGADVNGELKLTYDVVDGNGGVAPGTATIEVAAINDAPVAHNVAVKGTEDKALSGQLSASDVDGDKLTWALAENSAPANGSVTVNADGTFTYTPSPDWAGIDKFTVTVSDGQGGTTAQTVTVNVANVNDAPTIASVETLNVSEDGTASGSVAGSDVDAGDTVSYYLLDENGERVTELTTENGSVAIDTATGEYTFTPNADAKELGEGASAADSFQVVAFDGTAESAPQDVGVTITGSNDGPVVSEAVDLGDIAEDSTVFISTADLLANASDVDGDTLSVLNLSAVDADGNSVGTFAAGTDENGNEGFTFTPNDNYSGSITLDYEVSDGVASVPASATLDVEAVADAPELSVSLGDSETVVVPGETNPVTIGTDNVKDAGGGFSVGARTIQRDGSLSEASPDHLSINNNPPGFGVAGRASGADSELGYANGTSEQIVVDFDASVSSADVSFAWMNSGEHGSYEIYRDGVKVGEGVVTGKTDYIDAPVTLRADDGGDFDQIVFAAPGAGDDFLINSISFVAAEPDSVTVEYPLNITASLTDTDGSESLAIVVSGLPDGAALSAGTDNGDGTWTVTTDQLDGLMVTVPEGSGAFDLSVTATSTEASNGDTSSVSATVTVDAVEANEAPVVETAGIAGSEDNVISGTLEATDPNGDPLTFALAEDGGPANGELVLNSDGTYTYTPAENFAGQDSFTVTVSDGQGGVTTQTITVDVDAVADAPELSISLGEPVVETSTSSVSITNHVGSAGYNNSYGYYIKGEDGAPVSGKVIWGNIKEDPGATATIDGLDPDQVGFFVIPDGDRANSGGIDSGLELTFQQDSSGKWSAVTPNGTVLKGSGGANVMFNDSTLNPGGKTQMQDTADKGNQNWEDISSGGDRDFNDANFSVSWETQGSDSVTYPLEIETSLTDTDGSESLAIVVAGLPDGATLSNGTDNGDGTWTLTAEQLDGLTVTVPEGSDAFDLSVTATSTEASNGDSVSTSLTINVQTGEAEDTEAQAPSLTVDVGDANLIAGSGGIDAPIAGVDSLGNLSGATVVNGDLNSKIERGSGDDTIDITGNANRSIETGGGDNIVRVRGSLNDGGIETGSGDDQVEVRSSANAEIETGSGDDAVRVGGDANSKIELGQGNDRLEVVGNVNAKVEAGSGEDTVVIGGSLNNGGVELGSGDDKLSVGRDVNVKIEADSGNDTVTVGGNVNNGGIDMGAGNDVVVIKGNVWSTVDGGAGNDSIKLDGYTKADWNSNKNGIRSKVVNFENVMCKDGLAMGSAAAFEGLPDTYETPLTITAALNDTDGSESLSAVTIGNLPQGAVLMNGGEVMEANADGTYTVDVSSGEPLTLTMVTDHPVDTGAMEVSVSSTEANGGDVATTVVVGEGSDAGDAGDISAPVVEAAAPTIITGGDGDNVFQAPDGDSAMYGDDGGDTFLFDFSGGHDFVDGGAGGDWVDTIDLSSAMGEGMTMTIVSGDQSWTVTADNALDGINLGQDASGEVILTNAAGETQAIEFENVEQIKW